MTAKTTRRRAVLLTATTALWLLLFFANGIAEPESVSGVVVVGGTMLVAAILPLAAFIALILLARRLIKESDRTSQEKLRLDAMCFFLGPIGCLIVVFRLTQH